MSVDVNSQYVPIIGEKYSLGEILTAVGVQLSNRSSGLRLVLPPLPPVLCIALLGNYLAIEGTTDSWPSTFCKLSEKHLGTRWIYRGHDPDGAPVFCTIDAERLIQVIEVARFGKAGSYTYKVKWKNSSRLFLTTIAQGKVIDPVIVPFPVENAST